MKGQIAFSICASVGLHVGGALLLPWPDGVPEAREGVAQVVLELFDVTSSIEAPAMTSMPPTDAATQAPPEFKVTRPRVHGAPPVELKSEATATIPRADSPPATSKDTPLPVKATPIALARTEPPPNARAMANATTRGAPSGSISGVRYRERAALSYPVSALRQRIGGTVLLLVDIAENGRATGITVRHSSGNTDLDRAAISCARQSTYEPYRVHGVAQPCRVEAPFKFDASTLRR